MVKESERAPRTYGDLRKALAAADDPWQADPTKSDDEPLPEFPTGGDDTIEPADRRLGEAAIDELLRAATPPANPDIRAAWREEGLVPDADEKTARQRRGTPRKKRTVTPPSDSGG